jgi:hypothetical protein
LSIQTLRKIYREVREAGSWPSHTHAPPCGAETAGRAPRPAITFPFAADPISPNTITGRTTILWLAWQLFCYQQEHGTRHLYCAVSRHLPTANSCSYSGELTSSRSLRNHLAMARPAPWESMQIPCIIRFSRTAPPHHVDLSHVAAQQPQIRVSYLSACSLAGAATTNL